MILAEKIARSRTIITQALTTAKAPAVMCSFGKDSLVLCDLLMGFGVRDALYLDNIDEIVDEEYNARLVERFQLQVHPLPRGRGVLFFIAGLAQFFCYPFLSSHTMLPVPMALSPWQGKGDYLCVDEELRATHGTTVSYKFDVLFFGHKRCDLLDGGGSCLPWFPFLPAASQEAYRARMTPATPFYRLNELLGCSPLYDWSQADVWEYITAHRLPVSQKVYDVSHRKRRLFEHRACYRCHDPSLPGVVDCPQLGAPITNLGALLPRGPSDLVTLRLLSEDEAKELSHGIAVR